MLNKRGPIVLLSILSIAIIIISTVIILSLSSLVNAADVPADVNLPPKIFSSSDFYDDLIYEGETLEFWVSASDDDDAIDDRLSYKWYVNDRFVGSGRTYTLEDVSTGYKRVVAIVSDGEYEITREWQITVMPEQSAEYQEDEGRSFLIPPWVTLVIIVCLIIILVAYYLIRELKKK